MTIAGKELSIILDLGDGRQYRMDNGIVTNIEMSMAYDDIVRFDMDVSGPPMQVLGPSKSEVSISGILTNGALNALFAYNPDEEKLAESGLVHGVDFCSFCGSDWIKDRRGNCGACGGPKHPDKRG